MCELRMLVFVSLEAGDAGSRLILVNSAGRANGNNNVPRLQVLVGHGRSPD